jgi:heat shock protein 5
MKADEIIIGIDLGTTNSVAAIWKKKHLEIITDKFGNKTTPSIVAFNKYGKLSGYDAKKQLENNPENTIYDIKRLIGKNYSDNTVQEDKKYFTYNITEADNDNIVIKTKYGKKIYTPEEISAIILTKIKNISNKYLNTKIKQAVITIPAYFNDAQRQATKDAAAIAGIECVRMINEPTAAALAYGLNNYNSDINVLVYDLGGGTLDTSLLNIFDGAFRVLATDGNSHLGGEDFDEAIFTHVLEDFKKKYPNCKEEYYYDSLQKLRIECEAAKKKLSTVMDTEINVLGFYNDTEFNIKFDVNFKIDRSLFEKICEDLLIEAIRPVDNIMMVADEEHEISIKDIDEIILVGGSTRIPKIRYMLHSYFGKPPNCSLNPDYIVAAGAAIQGYLLSNSEDPFCKNMVLIDVIPLSLGIGSNNGTMATIIPRNSSIPIKKTQRFTTQEDYQKKVDINIYEGERKLVQDNYHLGKFILTGIEEEKQGVPDIRVSINVDVNGITSVFAVDKKSSSVNKHVISGNKRRLTQKQIDDMIHDAELNELEDKLKQGLITYYFRFANLYDMVEYNTVKNPTSKMNDDDKANIMKDVDDHLDYFEKLVKDYKVLLKLYKNHQEKEEYEKDNDVEVIIERSQKQACKELKIINADFKKKLSALKNKYASFALKMNNDEKDNVGSDVKTFTTGDNAGFGTDDLDVTGNSDTTNTTGVPASVSADTGLGIDVNEVINAHKDTTKNEFDLNELDNREEVDDDEETIARLNKDDDDMPERKEVLELCLYMDTLLESDDMFEHSAVKLEAFARDIIYWMNLNVHIHADSYVAKVDEIKTFVTRLLKQNKRDKFIYGEYESEPESDEDSDYLDSDDYQTGADEDGEIEEVNAGDAGASGSDEPDPDELVPRDQLLKMTATMIRTIKKKKLPIDHDEFTKMIKETHEWVKSVEGIDPHHIMFTNKMNQLEKIYLVLYNKSKKIDDENANKE